MRKHRFPIWLFKLFRNEVNSQRKLPAETTADKKRIPAENSRHNSNITNPNAGGKKNGTERILHAVPSEIRISSH